MNALNMVKYKNELEDGRMDELCGKLMSADAVVIGGGAGLSTSGGFIYGGERFKKYFGDFEEKYGFHDMYSGGFCAFESLEENWAYWSRFVYLNRYIDTAVPLYRKVLELVKEKEYFVLTTNVDHCFQKAGFDKARLFYTQGDYGLWQCSEPCCQETYDNEDVIREMVLAQGFQIEEDGSLKLPETGKALMSVTESLVPVCPRCGKPMTMNLRSDDSFVQDEGWYRAANQYVDFLSEHKGQKVLYLELGVGYNTPGIIKYPFWQAVQKNPTASYACINKGEAFAPKEIAERSVCIDGDINEAIDGWLERMKKEDADLTGTMSERNVEVV